MAWARTLGIGAAIIVGLAWLASKAPPGESLSDKRARENAELDRAIAEGLAREGVFSLDPKPAVDAKAIAEARWTAGRQTLACKDMRQAESFAFIVALGSAGGVTNPQSDPTQTPCRHVSPGAAVKRGEKVGDAGLVEVWVDGNGPLYALDAHLVPAK